MANSVTAVLFSLLLPSCLPGIKLDGAATVNVTKALTLNLATWNILAVSKCEMSANGFVGMDPKAFRYHNGGCTDKQKHIECVGTWIQEVLPTYFKDNEIDAMFLQEVDYPMVAGLSWLKRKGGLDYMPVTGMKEEIYNMLLKKRRKGEKKDFAYVVWKPTTVKIECRHVGEDIPAEMGTNDQGEEMVLVKKVDMSRVGLCTITKEGNNFAVLGMHGDGDKGFTNEQAKLILKTEAATEPDIERVRASLNIVAVLGDLNRNNAKDVRDAIEPLNGNLVVPDGGEMTVYRVAHKYRKLVQSIDNSKILKEKSRTEFKTITCEEKNTPKEDKENDVTGVTWCAEVDALKNKQKLKGKTFQFFELIKKENKELWDKIKEPTYNWRHFPQDIGLNPETLESANYEKAKWAMIPEITREDWAAFDKTIFTGQVTVPEHEKLKDISGYTGEEGSGSVDVMYPIQEMASDHLPVILKLKLVTGDNVANRQSARIRSKTPFKPFNRFVRRALRAFVRSGSAKS